MTSMLPPVKCLLVDDRDENLLVMSAILERSDIQLLLARSGEEALELLLAHDVALALLDVQMPGMDGFELAELMRGSQRTRDVPLIFVTAGTHDQHRLFKGYESGAVDFLYKPIEPHVLRSKCDVFFQLDRQKRQLLRELQEKTQMLRLNETFAAVLGHDLRNPLNAILTSAHLLREMSAEPMVRDAAARMVSSGNRMNRMIEDLLDLARARLGGGIPIHRAPVDFASLVDRVVQEHEAACAGRTIAVRRRGTFDGEWDADRLAQVASNLLGNALQHSDGSSAVEVELDGCSADSLSLSITNEGVVADDARPYLFEPFRGGVMRGGRQGLGLGLYIARQIVEAHGGRLTMDTSEQDAGSPRVAFHIEVPRREGKPTAAE